MVQKRANGSFGASADDGEKRGSPAVDSTMVAALYGLRPRIRAYLRHVIHDRAEREGAVSDVISEVLTRSVDQDIEKVPIWSLVLRVLRRIAREEWRRSREVRGDHVLDWIVADGEAQRRRAYRVALWAWEDAAMKHLTALQRGALELHVMDGLSDGEIAELLGCSQGSVRVLRAKAKKRLRDLVDQGVIPMPPIRGA